MRLTLPTYNPVKECSGCTLRDEKAISAHILSYQTAARLLMRYPGTWKIKKGEIHLILNGLKTPLVIDVIHGTVQYGSLVTQLSARYDVEKGLDKMTEDIIKDLGLPLASSPSVSPDKTFNLFVKLIEIFHARCGLHILPAEDDIDGWELYLCKEGPSGWIHSDGIAENRFGETIDTKAWDGLRSEKVATYLFGFNRFCRNYPSPHSDK